MHLGRARAGAQTLYVQVVGDGHTLNITRSTPGGSPSERTLCHVRLRRRRVRLGLVSDTHGAMDARLIEALDGCDAVAHAGDIGGAAVLETLARRRRPVIAVRGNNDIPAKWPRNERRIARSLPLGAWIDLPGGALVVVHGDQIMPAARRHSLLRRRYPQARAVVYGHSHRLSVDQDDVPWVLNPGAGGAVRTFGGPSCLVLEALAAGWRIEVIRFPLAPNASA